jgi:hypothetical protein
MGISGNLPIIVRTDNVGAKFLVENASSGVRTRHNDTRYHFIRRYVEDGLIKIVFVKKDENDSDLFIKNVNKDAYERHVVKFFENIDG